MTVSSTLSKEECDNLHKMVKTEDNQSDMIIANTIE